MAHKNREDAVRDRTAQRQRKNLRRKMANCAAVVAKHPQPWRWDHGVLYDASDAEIIRQSPFSQGKAGNPAPKPHEVRVPPIRREKSPNDFRSFSPYSFNPYINRPWGGY